MVAYPGIPVNVLDGAGVLIFPAPAGYTPVGGTSYPGIPVSVLDANGNSLFPPGYTGGIGFNVAANGGGATPVTLWNTIVPSQLMRAADVCHVLYQDRAQIANLSAGIGKARVLLAASGLWNNGTLLPATYQVDTAHLDAIDQLVQARDGQVAECILYSDENIQSVGGHPTTAQRITLMQQSVDFIRNYVRGSSGGGTLAAPAFTCCYVPGGPPAIATIPNNPLTVTYPDEFLLQVEANQTTIGGDPAFVSAVVPTLQNCIALAPTHPLGVQITSYLNTDGTQVFSGTKIQADINSLTGAVSLTRVNIFWQAVGNIAAAFQAMSDAVHLFRP